MFSSLALSSENPCALSRQSQGPPTFEPVPSSRHHTCWETSSSNVVGEPNYPIVETLDRNEEHYNAKKGGKRKKEVSVWQEYLESIFFIYLV